MRRDEMIAALRRVDSAIDSSNLFASLRELRSEKKNVLQAALVAFQDFSINYNNFSNVEKEICRIFDLEKFSNAEFWQSIILVDDNSDAHPQLYDAWQGLNNFKSFTPRLVQMLLRSSDLFDERLSEDEHGNIVQVGKVLRCYVRDPETPTITPSQLAVILESVQDIYHLIQEVHGNSDTAIIIASLDSGSDKSFDFLGAARILEVLSHLLTQSWDRVRFGEPMKFSKQVQSASDGIDFLKEIENAKEQGALTENDAIRIKRCVLARIEKLLAGGLYPEEALKKKPLEIGALPMRRQELLENNATGSDEKNNKKPVSKRRPRSATKKTRAKPRKPAGK